MDATGFGSRRAILKASVAVLAVTAAGGVLAALAKRHPVLTLSENRRQNDETERWALHQLRGGHADVAVGALREHGRVVTASNADTVRDAMVAKGWLPEGDGPDPSDIKNQEGFMEGADELANSKQPGALRAKLAKVTLSDTPT